MVIFVCVTVCVFVITAIVVTRQTVLGAAHPAEHHGQDGDGGEGRNRTGNDGESDQTGHPDQGEAGHQCEGGGEEGASGWISTLTYDNTLKATNGFIRKLKFDLDRCFTCLKCGTSPEYLIGEKKVEHLSEFGKHPDDDTVLCQGSHHGDRIFLPVSDRRKVVELLSGEMDMEDLSDEQLQSEHSLKLYCSLVLLNRA